MILSHKSGILAKGRYSYFLAKACLVLLLLCVIYYQLFVKNDFEAIYAEFIAAISSAGSWLWFCAVLLLMPLNWYLESYKWHILVSRFQVFSKNQAIQSVLAGVSLAIMTPGRIGEYGGKLLGVLPRYRPRAILSNTLSSLGQNIVNIFLGLLCALFYTNTFANIPIEILLSMITLATFILAAMMLVYFRIDLLGNLLAFLPDYRWVASLKSSVSTIASMDNYTLFMILGLSSMRYIVYSLQYVFLLYLFGVTDQFWLAVIGVGTVFLVQSNLPLPPALSIIARGEIAIFLWSVFTTNVIGILAATFTLWIINLVIPALLGAVIISRASFDKPKIDL